MKQKQASAPRRFPDSVAALLCRLAHPPGWFRTVKAVSLSTLRTNTAMLAKLLASTVPINVSRRSFMPLRPMPVPCRIRGSETPGATGGYHRPYPRAGNRF